MKSEIPAVLMCGGYSQRMGRPKHLLRIGDQFLWQVQLDRLKSIFNQVCISSRRDQANDFNAEHVIPDQFKDIGPFAGISTALRHFSGEDIFVLSVDTPSIKPSTMVSILNAEQPNALAHVAISKSTKKLQPLIARWNYKALAFIEDLHKVGNVLPYSFSSRQSSCSSSGCRR